VIDLHSHILPGIDDGPATFEQSLGIAHAASKDGTQTIVATPHVSWRYPNDVETIVELVYEMNAHLVAERIALEVRPGAEIALTRIADLRFEDLERLTLGGGPWLLIEPPFVETAYGLEAIVGELQLKGHRVVLAHPERCPAFHRDPRTLVALVSGGVLTSVTAGSLTGRFGGQVRRFAMRMLSEGLVHNVASDAHDVARRPPSIARELASAGMGPLSEWLTHEVPAAILSGAQIPARPAGAPQQPAPAHRRWWRSGR
jgi:protein-tyrosine phosphatase